MECSIIELPGVKEELDAIRESFEKTLELISRLAMCNSGVRVFKDGRDVTHRCKVTESETAVTVDIGCDLDEAIMRMSDPMEIQTVYMLRRNKTTGEGDTIALNIPKYMLEIINRVLPGSFLDNKTPNA